MFSFDCYRNFKCQTHIKFDHEFINVKHHFVDVNGNCASSEQNNTHKYKHYTMLWMPQSATTYLHDCTELNKII